MSHLFRSLIKKGLPIQDNPLISLTRRNTRSKNCPTRIGSQAVKRAVSLLFYTRHSNKPLVADLGVAPEFLVMNQM
jgi:hypothetical protein